MSCQLSERAERENEVCGDRIQGHGPRMTRQLSFHTRPCLSTWPGWSQKISYQTAPRTFGFCRFVQHQKAAHTRRVRSVCCRSLGGSFSYKSGGISPKRSGAAGRAASCARSGTRLASSRLLGGRGRVMGVRSSAGRRGFCRKEYSRTATSRPSRPWFRMSTSRSRTRSAGQGEIGRGVSVPGIVPLISHQSRSSPHVSVGRTRTRPSFCASTQAERSCDSCSCTITMWASTPITPDGRARSRRTRGVYASTPCGGE
mmetsp:Transcript_15494/g.49984  ORF Transcript_15494/g.49984 Transcript_15494/m.49984 type:complete len:257 (-) Transcript_15494:2890-3660(-)